MTGKQPLSDSVTEILAKRAGLNPDANRRKELAILLPDFAERAHHLNEVDVTAVEPAFISPVRD